MDATTPLPTGTVTFLLTDIEGSTRLWERHPVAMDAAVARHDALATEVVTRHGGFVVKHRGEGDSLFAIFADALSAVTAATTLQQAFHTEPWPEGLLLHVRVGLHTGHATLRDGDYIGADVNRCARLRAAAHGGQVLVSATTQELVRDRLPDGVSLRDLGSHRLKDLQQPQQIYQLLHPELPAEFPPLRSLEAFAHNLPAALTSFIGRQQEIAEVKNLLATTRLLTLTGSGGCGKTRLALQVAADLLEEYPDGVWLVELAALADPSLVPQAVASALGVREEPNRLLIETLTGYLKHRGLLLVLDNCEHLLAACAQLADTLLRSCPTLRFLASSREALGLLGEQTHRIPSLSLPDPKHLPPPERLLEFEAVQLFVDRARLSQATFALTPANARTVARVCEQLDGIPLAIELAAARVKALPVEQIEHRLEDRFRLLTGGSRTALPRQQTLRAAIDWSYDLLTDEERALLRRLSVFTGGFTLAAAEAVCIRDGLVAGDVLDVLTRLVEKSLVVYEEELGEGRYRLLETVRQYARDRLLEAGEAAAVRGRHLEWYVGLAEQAAFPLTGAATQGEWVVQLERELGNLRAALEWSTEGGATPEGRPVAEAGLRLAGRLRRFWLFRGYLAEVRERLARLLAVPGAQAQTPARANALFCAGYLASFQGDYGAARAALQESLVIRRELGDPPAVAMSLILLGNVALNEGDHRAARSQCEEGLELWRETASDLGAIAYSLTLLGEIACAQGEMEASRALLEESLTLWRECDDRWGTGLCLHRLGRVMQAQGDLGAACALYRESLALFRAVGEKRGMAECLEGFAGVAMASSCTAEREDSFRRTMRLFGAAAALRHAAGTPLPAYLRAAYDDHLATLCAELGEEAFTAEWEAGRTLPLDEAIALALDG